MKPIDALWIWWFELADVDRRRVLRLAIDDALPEDLATGLSMAGLRVIPLHPSPIDGRPTGYLPPADLLDFLNRLRRP